MTMKKVSGDLAKNRDYLDRQLGVGESFDVLYRNVEIGKKNAALYMIDGFCKDEVMQKLLQHFIGITKEQMPEDAAEMSRQLVPYGEVDLCGDLDEICRQQNFTSLRYHRLDDLIESIGIDSCKLCTYCFNGEE